MTAGMPGTGIGGVFYLLSAIIMPLNETVLTIRGKSSIARWLVVIRQLVIAGAIVCGMWLLGMVAGLVFTEFTAAQPIVPGIAREVHSHIVETAFRVNIFHIAPVIMSIATLAAILTLTNLLRLFVRPYAEKA